MIYWDDVVLFCYPDEYELGIREMKTGDIIEIDNLSELAAIDSSYEKYLGELSVNHEAGTTISMINTIPLTPVVLVVVLVTMMLFYSTSLDSIALTTSRYSYHRLDKDEMPHKGIQLMWCILLPIALVFAESSMNNLQSVSIFAAFPTAAALILIMVSFMKAAKKYLNEEK